MNFQTEIVLAPLRVLIVNPLTPSGRMVLVKILRGFVFGEEQLVDLILLVYSNEKAAAERLKYDLIQCAYPCYNTITVSSGLPSITDADVFCFLSNFYNLNKIELEKMETDEQFDALYLIIKIANNFTQSPPVKMESSDDGVQFKRKNKKAEVKPRKPILMADGIVAMDILMSLSKNLPPDIFFCPTTIPGVAKSVLGDYLKVQCNSLNKVLVWAANDEVFHVEVNTPIVVQDQQHTDFPCYWEMPGKTVLSSIEADHTQFNPSWMKKEFLKKVTSYTKKNPYGCIFRAILFARSLKCIWTARSDKNGKTFHCNMGIISDGSLGTLKGHPYVLPLRLCGDTWSVAHCYEKSPHLRNELKRINTATKEHHQMLIPFCKRFLQEHVINHAFIPLQAESSSAFTTTTSSSRTSIQEQ